jgi:cytidylate kinase|uniref:Cytidylate kinase n=1 Tax=candidate division WOR-3 bacterium TaxID=2052148 RepID=A0A7C3YSX4_UNCW3
MKYWKVAVDGLSGSGKTTMAKLAAKRLNCFYLETGSFYRALTFEILRRKINFRDGQELASFLSEIKIKFDWDGEEVKIYLNGEDVSQNLRLPAVDRIVSFVSEIKEVRTRMVKWQREIAQGRNVIGEGRDIGSVVFPDANLKVFVTCDLMERARRRRKELMEKGISIGLMAIMKNLKKRDRIDSLREISPLIRVPEAIYIDTTRLTIEEEVDLLIELIRRI